MQTFWTILSVLLFLFALWVLAIAPRTRNKPDLTPFRGWYYAHRGCYRKDQTIPENSLPGFARAVEEKFGVELDVHLTKDGKLAVLHDENLKRMCGVEINLAFLNSWELKKYKLNGTENTIPLFLDVLPVIHGKVPMIIEVKPYGGNIGTLCEQLCRELEGYSGLYGIESFDPRVLMWFKRHRPEIVRGQLAMKPSRYRGAVLPVTTFAAGNLLMNFLTRPDFIAYCVEDRKNLSFCLCKLIYGVQEFAWTVRNPWQARKVTNSGGLVIFEYFDPRACLK